MPGYYVHLASSNPKARRDISFVKGVEMPDLLKTYYKLYGLDKTREKYNEIKTPDMPDFSFFERRVQEKDLPSYENGMHYGPSANPNVRLFWNSLTEEEKQNPFYRGYLWHLITDLYTKQVLGIYDDIDSDLLHQDWDRLNIYIKDFYPSVKLPREIEELHRITYKDDNIFNYVDPINMKEIIDYLSSFDILNGDVDAIIDEIVEKAKKRHHKK